MNRNSGEKSSQWIDGRRIFRKIALANYPFICNRCGSKKQLEVHHKDKNRQNSKLKNLVILCKSCHTKEHRTKSIIVCVECNLKKLNYAKNLCEECYKELWEKDNKERHLKISRDWKRKNRPYINDYKKWRRGTLKEKPKLDNYR